MRSVPVASFPSISLPSSSGGLPVEVSLITQLGIGAGASIIAATAARQRGHAAFVDALDEPSARLGSVDMAKGDATALYSFIVGASGHPFHRHAGHRVFTAISGSAGTRLRFSTASQAALDQDPASFIAALRHVIIPPDCLFTVRFGGGVWHQFLPDTNAAHPALFALSCHTDELGGDLPADLRAQVIGGSADIPALTEVLPAHLQEMLDRAQGVPTTHLTLHAPAGSLMHALCAIARSGSGRVRSWLARVRPATGFTSAAGRVQEVPLPAGSLLGEHLAAHAHEDCFEAVLSAEQVAGRGASELLAAVLDGFVKNPPRGVGSLMKLRNVLVAPLRLRTSPLGCPVSSLLCEDAPDRFAARFPVHAKRASPDRAEVILGSDDRHLAFRSCIEVQQLACGRAQVRMATRVRPSNMFGQVYLASIDLVHRKYVSPRMLGMAVAHAAA